MPDRNPTLTKFRRIIIVYGITVLYRQFKDSFYTKNVGLLKGIVSRDEYLFEGPKNIGQKK